MPHILFEYFELENFRSYSGKHKFDFGDVGLHLLKGRNKAKPSLGANDAGKSTLWDGLCWILSGRMIKGLRNNKTVPWDNPKAMPKGHVSFLLDKKRHALIRTANPNRITLDGAEIDQNEVHRQLGLPFEILTHTLLMGQGRPLFFDLANRDRMELFSDTLRLSRWEERSKVAANWLADVETVITQLNSSLTEKRRAFVLVKADYSEAKLKASGWEEEQDREITLAKKEIKTASAQLDKVSKIKDTADLASESIGIKLADCRTQLNKIIKRVDEMQEDRNKLTRDIANEQASIKTLREKLGEMDADHCPTCGQSIKGSDFANHRHDSKSRMVAYKKKLNGLEFKMMTLEGSIKDELTTREKLGVLHGELYDKVQKHESTLRIAATDVANYSAKLVSLRAKVKDLEEGENPWKEQQTKLRKRRDALATSIEEISEKLADAEKTVEPTKFWVQGFKDVRLSIMDEVLQELEMATNSMLPEIGLIDWEVLFDIEKELKSGAMKPGLNVRIYSPDNKEAVDWEEWGGGVGQRLRLVSALALSDVLLNHAGITTNLEILDEPTRSLNVEGVSDLCEFLADRAESQGKSIWLVDHRSIESTAFSSVRTVVKDASGSTIV